VNDISKVLHLYWILSFIIRFDFVNNSTPISRFLRFTQLNRLADFSPVLLALLLALIVSSFLLLALNADPIAAYGAMIEGAFGTENATAETLVKATPILFVAIGITVAFRGGMINIGGEGQMIAGALAGTTVALVLGPTRFDPNIPRELIAPDILVITLSLIAGFIAGALYGGLAGFLKAYFDVNEILSTIMLNQIAVQMMNYLLNGPLLDPASAGVNNIPKTARLVASTQLPRLWIPIGDPMIFARTRLHWGILIAIVLAVVIYIFLWRTSLGYKIRAVGENQRASSYAGINVKRQMMFSMFLAGGFAGLAGVVQVLGLQYRLQTDGSPTGFTGNAGFNGIVAALFGGLNPLGAIPASAFFGGLLVGAQKMQRDTGVTASLITAINGLIVVFVVSSEIFIRRRAKQRVQIAKQDNLTGDETPTPTQEAN
jgi:simple sugar transport system permease protein